MQDLQLSILISILLYCTIQVLCLICPKPCVACHGLGRAFTLRWLRSSSTAEVSVDGLCLTTYSNGGTPSHRYSLAALSAGLSAQSDFEVAQSVIESQDEGDEVATATPDAD